MASTCTMRPRRSALLLLLATTHITISVISAATPNCDTTAFVNIYGDSNATLCADYTGFYFDYPRWPLSAANASWICSFRSCRAIYENIFEMGLPTDCLLANDRLLFRDVMDPLMESPSCNRTTVNSNSASSSFGSRAGSGFTNVDVGSSDSNSREPDDTVFPVPAAPGSPDSNGSRGDADGNGSMTAVAIVSITVGALLAFVVVVVAVVWYKRQRLRDLHMAAYGDAFMVAGGDKPGDMDQDQHHRGRGLDIQQTELTASSQDMSGPLPPSHRHDLHLPLGNTLWNDEELLARHMRSEDIDDIRVIGSGGHGVVYLVRYRQGRLLASKRLVSDHVTRAKTRALITEIKLVAKLDHPCIVQFVGAAWTTESDLQALFEYMPNGDLCTYLAKTSHDEDAARWHREKMQIAMDIVEALVYVHSFAPPLVHRDLKSRNVLLTDDLRAKLSDFGVSRYQSENCTMTGGVGTSRWLAPEVISGGGEYDQSCDIYSLGMVFSEMDTHRLPFSDLRMPSGNPMPEMSILQLVSQGKLQPTFSSSCPDSVRAIALRCLAFDPKERPNAIEISYILRTIAKTEFAW